MKRYKVKKFLSWTQRIGEQVFYAHMPRGTYYFPFLWMAKLFMILDDPAAIYTYRLYPTKNELSQTNDCRAQNRLTNCRGH